MSDDLCEQKVREAYAAGWQAGEKAGAEGVKELADTIERLRAELDEATTLIMQARGSYCSQRFGRAFLSRIDTKGTSNDRD